MNALNTTSAVALIAARFNALKGTNTEVKTLAKRGKIKLLTAIAQMEAEAAKVIAAQRAVSTKTGSVKAAAEALLVAEENGSGLTYDAILAKLLAQFPGAKTSVGCLRWYAAKMTTAGTVLPKRARNKKVVAA